MTSTLTRPTSITNAQGTPASDAPTSKNTAHDIDEIDVVVVGAGQAGIAASEHLSNAQIPHIVLEKARIAEQWRTARWDSLVANGPCWHDRFPGLTFADYDPDAFVPKDRIAEYFVQYARMINAPIRCGVEVTSLQRHPEDGRFLVTTTDGTFLAHHVILATGAFQKPAIPPLAPESLPVTQIHSSQYRNPSELAEGGVLVVGAGSSGVQIAAELRAAGRDVYLAVGPHDRPPRRYRNRDNVWWLGVLGKWGASAPNPGTEHVTIAVTGAHGGYTIDFRDLADDGIQLLGRAESTRGSTVYFQDNLRETIETGDANYLSVLEEADQYIADHHLDLPEEPDAHILRPLPESIVHAPTAIDLEEAGISTIIWATGFTQDFSWVHEDIYDTHGRIAHERGVSPVNGLYFLGLPWQQNRGSTFIWGVWHDAKYVVEQLAIQRGYASYTGAARRIGQ